MKKKSLKLSVIVLSIMIAAALFGGCGDKNGSVSKQEDNTSSSEAFSDDMSGLKQFKSDELLSGKHHVSMELKDFGTVTLELDADQAPITVTNFCELVKSGFYDGLTFHRILTGNLIQGGDPEGTGMGGPGYSIKGEFAINGVDNAVSHTAGAISMARSSLPDSAGSQFFICTADCSYYDGQYAAFGHVTEGLDLVTQICNTVSVQDENGTVAASEQPIITKMTLID